MSTEDKTHSHFELSKFYLDCINKNGDAMIIYAARLRWRKIAFSYLCVLDSPAHGKTQSHTLPRSFSDPHRENEYYAFAIPSLHVHGKWHAKETQQKHCLMHSPDGSITWDCFAPHAKAEIEIAGRKISGFGYAEHLHMTLEPWKMPIHELRWGRFLSEKDSLVWIQWRGPHPLDLTLHNGKQIHSKASFSDKSISFPNLSLELIQQRELRNGTLLETALKPLKSFMKFFPSSILNTHESKWVASAKLSLDGSMRSNGFTLHELVTFPKTQK